LKKGGKLFSVIHTSDIHKHRQSKPVLGGSCSASFIPATFINTSNPSPEIYEKIQRHGNQTLKRPIFVELKKGGKLFSVIHTSDIHKHRQSKPVFLILDIMFSTLEKCGEQTKWGGEEKKS